MKIKAMHLVIAVPVVLGGLIGVGVPVAVAGVAGVAVSMTALGLAVNDLDKITKAQQAEENQTTVEGPTESSAPAGRRWALSLKQAFGLGRTVTKEANPAPAKVDKKRPRP